MSDKPSKPNARRTQATQKLDPELYAQLRAELKTPYKGLRQFIYLACGASGVIGAFIFLTEFLAKKDVSVFLPNFALQIGVIALMIWLFRLEQRTKPKP